MVAHAYISPDILEDILIRLPAKSLPRLKSVSKQWNILISDSNFIKAHKARAHKNRHVNLMYYYKESKTDFETYFGVMNSDIGDSEPVFRAVATESPIALNELVHIGTAHCGGLLCLLSYNEKIVVWNPSTNQRKRYSLPPKLSCSDCSGLGLGYASSNDEYKVVVVSSKSPPPPSSSPSPPSSSNSSKLHILSLKTGFWKKLKSNIGYNLSENFSENVATACNGCLYWISDGSIICIDLEKERDYVMIDRSHEILRHNVPREMCSNLMLWVSEGALYLASYNYDSTYCDIWVMKDGEWMKVLKSRNPRLFGSRRVLYCADDSVLLKGWGGVMFLCNLRDDSVKNIEVHGSDGLSDRKLRCIVPYEVSLVKPGGDFCM